MSATIGAQLANMAGQAKVAMGADNARWCRPNRGYFSGEEVLVGKPLGVTPYVPEAAYFRVPRPRPRFASRTSSTSLTMTSIAARQGRP